MTRRWRIGTSLYIKRTQASKTGPERMSSACGCSSYGTRKGRSSTKGCPGVEKSRAQRAWKQDSHTPTTPEPEMMNGLPTLTSGRLVLTLSP
eukprot:2517871-Alexandrium_andersonii.AAC.1